MTLSVAIIPGQSEHGSNGNEEVLRIPQSSSITGTSPSDFFVSYPGYSLGVTSLQICSRCILLPKPTGQCYLLFDCILFTCRYIIKSIEILGTLSKIKYDIAPVLGTSDKISCCYTTSSNLQSTALNGTQCSYRAEKWKLLMVSQHCCVHKQTSLISSS